jgi:nitrite reductase/ring-hydroxylating ferredoxin subunit
MPYVKVAERSKLVAGERVIHEERGHEVLVLALDDEIYAIGNVCTHDEVWLDDGTLHPESCEIECPMHAGRFDLRTGAATHEPAETPVPSYAVRVDGDDVLIDIP